MDSLDEHIDLDLKDLKKREFLIFHPALSYFARDYHLKQIPVEHEGKEPTPGRIRDLVNQAKQNNISAVFIQEQFSTDEARVLAREIDAAVVRIDPLSYDWMNTMHTITAKISASLEGRSN